MIEMLISGQVDPEVLAELAKGRMRPKIPALVEALEGRWGRQHSVVAKAIIAHIDFLDTTIDELSDEIVEATRPFDELVRLWSTIPGVSTRTAEMMVAEIGADMGRFPSAKHLAAWAGLAPASHESAGKRRPAGTRQGSQHLQGAPLWKPPVRREPKGRSFPSATSGSLGGEDRTKPLSRSLTACWSPPTTWPSPGRSTATWAPATTTTAKTPKPK
ncbi:MAG: IS110 family transposase [Candidatus Microthrix sp.]|uniref:IS110 family transposase n=1 Tax=Candidatus Neomicrothrix subdominans TaxID=2954438 RepID=A0A936NCI3_9ACTN|nr:IS110 family transposase [Candidatus Microthrix subdominans]